MSEKWDGKVFTSTPGGPVVTMSLGDVLARKDDEIERLRAEVGRLRASNERLHRALFRIAGKAPFADDPWTIARKAMKREAKP